MSREVAVVGAAIVRDGTVLAAQRGESMALAGLWEFPGGKIEPGETPRQALVRELREEFRCGIEVGDRVETTRHAYDFGVVTLTTYYATVLDGEPELTEHTAMRWLPIDRLLQVTWAPADRPAVRRIMRDGADGRTGLTGGIRAGRRSGGPAPGRRPRSPR